jgi:hypothetical protein
MSTTNFAINFLDAMERHWQDAELLYNQVPQRLANADQLYGLTAECGLKALMEKGGMDIVNNQAHKSKYKKHINATWSHFSDFRQGRLALYALPNTNPFNHWLIDHRYASCSDFDAVRVQQHQAGAQQVINLARRARDIDGILP